MTFQPFIRKDKNSNPFPSTFKVSRYSGKDEVMPEESESSLRRRITAYMSGAGSSRDNWFCTWWFRFHIEPFTTKQIRRELEVMKREGLVDSDHSQSNNTKWRLTKYKPDGVTP